MKKKYVLTIRADNKSGLLHSITGIINRRLIEIESLTASKTDVNDVVLITIEIICDADIIIFITNKIKNIIEVYDAHICEISQALTHRVAIFKISTKIFESQSFINVQKYGATILKVDFDAILISKSGSAEDIISLYNQLDGPNLIGFSQTGLITDTQIINNGDDLEWRIRLLAA